MADFETTTSNVPDLVWSWQTLDWQWSLVVQLVVAIVGILGNLLVVIVMFQRRSHSRSTDILIQSLAVADMLTSILLIPIPDLKTAPDTFWSEIYCRFIDSQLLMWIAITASTYTLVTVSVDRYFAIVYPLAFNRLVSRGRVAFCIVLTWLAAFSMCFPGVFVFNIDDATGSCNLNFNSPQAQLAFGAYTFVLRLVVPILIMLVTQTLIARNLFNESNRFADIKDEGVRSTGLLAARSRIIKMMLIVIIIYVICWAPNQIAFFGVTIGFIPFTYINSTLHRALTVLAFFNSCMNPVVYIMMNPHFREAIKDLCIGTRSRLGPLFEQKIEVSADSLSSNAIKLP
ncbi:gastrin/cholecystokinin type B receptor [Strongylocentrotus purpuratus]|uniref:G-protein coupled receptors family 1 profile domain-containing protein n=1 Tax=Strongylocentrotus purpuratus TaxID=7668 RepID=A0A7M7GFM7_STRPU|nr:gastrin/cholecystokinin type B receptor [Strongylocentrotus purpuratus]